MRKVRRGGGWPQPRVHPWPIFAPWPVFTPRGARRAGTQQPVRPATPGPGREEGSAGPKAGWKPLFLQQAAASRVPRFSPVKLGLALQKGKTRAWPWPRAGPEWALGSTDSTSPSPFPSPCSPPPPPTIPGQGQTLPRTIQDEHETGSPSTPLGNFLPVPPSDPVAPPSNPVSFPRGGGGGGSQHSPRRRSQAHGAPDPRVGRPPLAPLQRPRNVSPSRTPRPPQKKNQP